MTSDVTGLSDAVSVRSSSPSSLTIFDTYSSSWFVLWLKQFLVVSDDATWRELVSKWAQYEMLNAPEGVCPIVSCLAASFNYSLETTYGFTTRQGTMVD